MEELENNNAVPGMFALDVVMSYQGLGLVRGRARSISPGGMTVETGPIMLPLDALLKVSFTLPQGDRDTVYKADAVVVRHNAKSATLRFRGVDERVSRRLRELSVDNADQEVPE
jgi:hypothetical protein